ncbi:hypothetical protein TBLA_0G00990 [Henningerozyma blattae CBS 6284]|uniref:Uncharacterized protein n=1 Tax=Henningerozyma blattae (strain ATCC 34711 / CBS 6284 / DSM 70876 / NBRC 10599 / NRRL Y-10934 / UCD 77-7) TaxID=1071380 RepID=I2H6P4_HENB6|nr:hypothetical protein TBLA_0G00990 [Tetrapisispora blattae CBS 6284]CCH62046.1 hypothetical protein TBLA_0G00990 [Tetrapisispora blattae CBS 6284]
MAPPVTIQTKEELDILEKVNRKNRKDDTKKSAKPKKYSITQYECFDNDKGQIECFPFKRIFQQVGEYRREITDETTNM